MMNQTENRDHYRNRRYALGIILLLAVLAVLMMGYICAGSVTIAPKEVAGILFHHKSVSRNNTAAQIIGEIRLPRMWAALILGGALSVSGYLLQTFFGNPIAGPYVLGISSGAKLVVALVMVFLLGRGIVISSWGMVIAAFAGSLLSMGIVLALSLKVQNMSILVVCGIMIGYICTAVTDLVVTFADDSNIVNLHNWSQGSFSGTDWGDVRIIVVLTLTGVTGTFLLSKPVSAYQMGENYARSVGVNIRLLRILLILLSSLLSACVTAFAGPVSFVGIAVPHLIRRLTKTAKPIQLIPACFLGGGAVTLLCDGIARCAFAPLEVSVSSVTAVFLAPVVVILMVRQRSGQPVSAKRTIPGDTKENRPEKPGIEYHNGYRGSVSEAAISCDHASVGYHGIPLVSDITFAAMPGQILTLIGPNGAGKSTILKSITRQLKILGGAVYLNRKSLGEISEKEAAREMAVVLTERTGTEWMTCRDVASLGRYPYTGKLGVLSEDDRKKVEDTLQQVGAADIADLDFREVSDGQRQRVLLARALCQEADVLVLDEPTSFLDLHYKRVLLRLIREAAEEQHIAVVMSLHELDLARQISDCIVCVKDGRIWKMGKPDYIFTGDTIEQLFDLPEGSYDPVHGTLRIESD